MYTNKVLKHFRHPKNMGTIENPDGIGKVGNQICGDVLWLYIKVKKDKKGRNIISEIRFQTFGCVTAISTSSMITTLAKGKTIEEALKITKNDIIKSLGNLPPIKVHCSVLAIDALSEAIYDYYKRNNFLVSRELEKKHKDIQQVLEYVEKKHKGYIEFEEDLMKNK